MVMMATDRLYFETPGVGNGYVAGINVSGSTTGADFIPFDNGRPGFAWYFGRDYLWMSLSLSLTNQWEKSKENFRLLARYQDDSGKIMHELPTSVELLGLDRWKSDFPYFLAAADSTPLYIVALKRYLDCSGDVEFLQELWPSIEKAFRWLVTTDYDGDGLIDNFEGHGWVEGGPLAYNQIAKGHTTFIWPEFTFNAYRIWHPWQGCSATQTSKKWPKTGYPMRLPRLKPTGTL